MREMGSPDAGGPTSVGEDDVGVVARGEARVLRRERRLLYEGGDIGHAEEKGTSTGGT